MQKILTLFFSVLAISLSAQFKTIHGTFGPVDQTQVEQETNNPTNFIRPNVGQYSRHSNSAFNLKPMTNSSLLNLKSKEKFQLFKNGDGSIIAVEAKIDYKSKNATSTASKVEFFMESVLDQFGLTETDKSYKVLSENIDELGMSHVKVLQMYKEVPIFDGELILHGEASNFNFLNGKITPKFELDVAPTISVQMSETNAINSVGKLYDGANDPLDIFAVDPMKTELVVFPFNGKYTLAYHHSFYSDLMTRWELFLDAKTGAELKKYQSICKFHNHNSDKGCSGSHDSPIIESAPIMNSTSLVDGPQTATAIDLLGISRTIDVYNVGTKNYLIDATREMFRTNSSMPDDPEGAIWTINAFNTSPQNNSFNYDHVTSTNNVWNDKSSVSAQYNGAKAYLYFRSLHTRNSINGSGGNIIGLINVADEDGQSMGNAFWNGQAMFYGNGDSAFKPLAGGLDVAGHEMTHGVVQSTANLTYQGESGALNESFADIFGAMIDRDDWQIGEDVVKPGAFPSGALRSLSNPHNGAATGDFGSGWQPLKYSERYTGSEDNGGVHINSGIPNYAFYLFASDTRLGATENDRKIKAEKVYYRALTQYLTKSSQFVDARIAVEKAAKDLYGDAVSAAAGTAFDKVEVFGSTSGGGTYQNDAQTNPGDDLIVCTNSDNENIYLFDEMGNNIANPQLSTSNPISKPSVTDRGDIIVFVGDDKQIHFIIIDWETLEYSEGIFSKSGNNQWRNAVISKDGNLLAALTDQVDNKVVIYDITFSNGNLNLDPSTSYTLKNPTYTTGISTGDVLYADAMEFDYTGEYLMYDAENSIKSTTAGSIEFWDIGFIKVWNKASSTFALPDQIDKLFQGLPEGVSVGNPTFSKNSNYIIAFDFIEDTDVSILGANIETGDVKLIYENSGLAYPTYSRTDEQLVFDYPNSGTFDLGIAEMKADKIEGEPDPFLFLAEYRWATWFSNGVRTLTGLNENNISAVKASIAPNPTSGQMLFSTEVEKSQKIHISIVSLDGKSMLNKDMNLVAGSNDLSLNVNHLQAGTYILKTLIDGKSVSLKFIKI